MPIDKECWFSTEYLKEKIEENNDRINSVIKSLKLSNEDFNREIQLLRGNKLHNIAVMKELKMITHEEYLKLYGDWQDEMGEYWFGEKK